MNKRSPKYGTEDRCPKALGGHRVNWDSLAIENNGEEIYIDVACRFCGRSGCLGVASKLEKEVSW